MGTFKYDQGSDLLHYLGGKLSHGIGEHILLCRKDCAEISVGFGSVGAGLSAAKRAGSIASSVFSGSISHWFQ